MRGPFYASVLILLSGLLFGQSNKIEIKGKVISGKKQNLINAEVYLKVNSSVYKTITDQTGAYKFSIDKSKFVAQLYVNATGRTVGSSSKRTCLLANKTVFKIDLNGKIESAYDFEIEMAQIDYSSPVILFKINAPEVVLDVKYSNTSANIEEVMEYFYKLTKEYPKLILDIDGMISNNETEIDLSLKRAKYIASLLVKKGVAENRIKCSGRGTSLPEIADAELKKAKNSKEEERLQSLNRRATIKVLTIGEGVEGNRKYDDE